MSCANGFYMDQPKIERVLRLLSLMAGNVDYTLEDLAERLETSTRSIYRYLDTFKEAGFVVHKKEGGIYKLGKESPYFQDISQLVHFTDEEAHIVNQLIEALDETNLLKQNLRRKLASVYDCTYLASSIVKGKNATNVNRLVAAIRDRKQVILESYASSHAGTVRDRHVEPLGFTTNYVQLWCYDVQDGENKLFNTARIASVRVLDKDWAYADRHQTGYIDIFRFAGFARFPIRLELNVKSRNLLLEEYPLSERDIVRQADGAHWILDTEVCGYAGPARFVIGLFEDIRILGSEEFRRYIRDIVEKNHRKICS